MANDTDKIPQVWNAGDLESEEGLYAFSDAGLRKLINEHVHLALTEYTADGFAYLSEDAKTVHFQIGDGGEYTGSTALLDVLLWEIDGNRYGDQTVSRQCQAHVAQLRELLTTVIAKIDALEWRDDGGADDR